MAFRPPSARDGVDGLLAVQVDVDRCGVVPVCVKEDLRNGRNLPRVVGTDRCSVVFPVVWVRLHPLPPFIR